MRHSENLLKAIASSLAAGKAVLEIYHSGFDIRIKSDQSPVTAADLASHAVLVQDLGGTGVPVLSEEGRHIEFEERKAWNQFWLIDPLDGTKEFIHRNGEFTVNVALIEHNKPVLGVVYAPASDELYAGIAGAGWWYLSSASSVRINAMTDLTAFKGIAVKSSMYTVAISRSHQDEKTENYLREVERKKGGIRRIAAGSSMKLCLVAHGKADEYPRFGPTNEWDIAAGHAVLIAAGKDIRTYPEGLSLTYNKASTLNGPFIAR